MNDGTLYPLYCQMFPAAVDSILFFFSLSHPWPIVAHELILNLPRPSSFHKWANWWTTHKEYTETATKPNFAQTWCNATAELGGQEMCEFIYTIGPRPKFHLFTILNVTLLWFTRGRATELVCCLWEKDKRPAESIEIGAPVFITLVYRLNSHLLSPSAKCPVDLLSSCLHLKQFIKNEWVESETLRAARWEPAADRKRKWRRR